MALDEDFAELLLDFAELLDATLEEDLTELLDFTELLLNTDEDDLAELLLDRSSPPSAELRAGSAEDDERTELLDFGATLEEDFALLLDSLLLLDPFDSADAPLRVTLLDEEEDSSSMQSSHTDEEESSSRGVKLLSSSPHAVKESPATARNIAKETRKERLIYPPNAVLSQNTNENIT